MSTAIHPATVAITLVWAVGLAAVGFARVQGDATRRPGSESQGSDLSPSGSQGAPPTVYGDPAVPPEVMGQLQRQLEGPAPARLAIGSTSASRYLPGNRAVGYPPGHAFDDDLDTAWAVRDFVSGADWVEARLARRSRVSFVRLTTGYLKVHRRSGDLFVLNDHVRRVRVETDAGSFEASAGRDQRWLDVPIGVETSRVRLVLLDVWRGTRWADLSISEIQVFGTPTSSSSSTRAAAVPSAPQPTQWTCLCAQEEDEEGFAIAVTACRPSPTDCDQLERSAAAHRHQLRGLTAACRSIGFAEHPGDLREGRGAWRGSARAGGWQIRGRCIF